MSMAADMNNEGKHTHTHTHTHRHTPPRSIIICYHKAFTVRITMTGYFCTVICICGLLVLQLDSRLIGRSAEVALKCY